MSTPQVIESPLTPYVPRLLIEWQSGGAETSSREIEGTLIFVDISGFTAMSERLARKGKVGAEEVTDVLNSSFSRLLEVAWEDSGGLLKFGGDALLLFFSGREHASRACHAAVGMRRALRDSGRLKTSAGLVSLRMSVGIHSGEFQFFLAGESHRELIVTGPAASQTVAMEAAADAGDILLSPATAAALDESLLGELKGEGRLLRKAPAVPRAKAPPPMPRANLDLAAFVPVALRRRVAAALDEGEHRQVTVGFVHFGGTDALLAGDGSGEVLRRLNELIRAIQRATSEHEICFLGTDIDRDGGKVILTAGAPESSGNDEERILRALRVIADGEYGLELRIGVNRGHVFAGDVGATFRRTYTVRGDAVNLAARLMQRAGRGQILATAEVLERSPTLFKAKALEPFAVKGKTRPVLAYSVGAISGLRQKSPARQFPFVGREREIETLCAALEAARQGNGSLVELIGEAGIGKSRLVEELRTRCVDMTYVDAACEQYESSTPYSALRRLLRPLIGIKLDEDARKAGRSLRQRLRAVAPELAPWLPLLAIPVDARVPSTRESGELEPKFKKGRLHQVVTEFLVKLLPKPAALVFEDVHWMDEASCELLRDLLQEVAVRPWVVCVTRRPEEAGFSPPQDVTKVRIRMEPLTPEAAEALARAATEEMLLPQHEVVAIAERAGGNPLFLQELAAASGVAGELETLPENIGAVITARIDTLGPQGRTLLRYASVVGPSFSP
ncbi:MAG: adenylate/guanylate cyclase domain-containing protein, partial [Dehalococcoidia bacterium]